MTCFHVPLAGRETFLYCLFDAIRGTPAGIMVLRVMQAERTNTPPRKSGLGRGNAAPALRIDVRDVAHLHDERRD